MHRSGTLVAICLTAMACVPSASASASAEGSAAAWHRISAERASARSDTRLAVQPARFQALELDRSSLEGVLSGAPNELAAGVAAGPSLTISLPTPGGGLRAFRDPAVRGDGAGLAARHPEISTYSGTGIDVPGATVHLDLGSLGFHASVIGPEGGVVRRPVLPSRAEPRT